MIRHPAERHLIRLALHSLWDANFFICTTNPLRALCLLRGLRVKNIRDQLLFSTLS